MVTRITETHTVIHRPPSLHPPKERRATKALRPHTRKVEALSIFKLLQMTCVAALGSSRFNQDSAGSSSNQTAGRKRLCAIGLMRIDFIMMMTMNRCSAGIMSSVSPHPFPPSCSRERERKRRRGEGVKAVRVKIFRGTGRFGCAALRVEGGEGSLARHRSTVQHLPFLPHKKKTAALSCPSLPLMMRRRRTLGKEGSNRRPGAQCVTVGKSCVAQRETQQETTRSVRTATRLACARVDDDGPTR